MDAQEEELMSKKKRQMITLLGLVVVLAAFGIIYGILSKKAPKEEGEEESKTEEILLYSVEKEKITRIDYTMGDVQTVLVLEDGTWYKEDEKELPLEQSIPEAMVTAMAKVTAQKELSEAGEDLSQFGLDKPSLSVEITADGETHKLVMGLETVGTDSDGYYAYMDDASKVYTIMDTWYSYFDYVGNQLIARETGPTFDAANVTRLSVDAKKGTDFEAVYDVKDPVGKDIYGWVINKAFKEKAAGDSYSLSELFNNYSSISFYECVSYDGSKKNDKKYGLDKPAYTIDFTYFESQGTEKEESDKEPEKVYHSYKFYVGKETDDGEYYYVKPDGSKRIYMMASEKMEPMVQIKPMTYIYQYCYLGSVNTLDTVHMEYDGKEYDMVLSRKETDKGNKDDKDDKDDKDEKSDSGEEGDEEDADVTYSATINGEEVDEEDFRMAYAKTGVVKYTGIIDEKKVPEDNTPYVSFRIVEGERDTKLEFLPYDGTNFFRASINGRAQFLVDKKTVEELVQGYLDVKDGTYDDGEAED